MLFNLGTFGILSRVALGCGGPACPLYKVQQHPWFLPTRSWWHLPLPPHCDNPKRPRHDRCPLGAESALVEKPCAGHSTLVISHNSYHTQVSLPPSLETRSQAGTRHLIYLTPRSGLCAPPAPTGVIGSLCQVPQQRIVSVRGRPCRDPMASPFYGPLTLDVTLRASERPPLPLPS